MRRAVTDATDECRQRTSKLAALVHTDVRGLAVDFGEHAREFALKLASGASEGTGRRFGGQRARAIEQLGSAAHTAVDGLQSRQTVVGVLDTLRENRFAGPEPVRNRQAGRVVAAVDNAKSGSDFVDGFAF